MDVTSQTQLEIKAYKGLRINKTGSQAKVNIGRSEILFYCFPVVPAPARYGSMGCLNSCCWIWPQGLGV